MADTQSRAGTKKENEKALQAQISDPQRAVQPAIIPRFPIWPTSQPGPLAKQPPPGQKPVNAIRSEQVAEITYDQSTGEPFDRDPRRYHPDEDLEGRTSFDQQITAQELMKERPTEDR